MKEYKTVATAKSGKAFRKHDAEVNRLTQDGWEVIETQVRLTQAITKLQREYDPTKPQLTKAQEQIKRNKEQWAAIRKQGRELLQAFKKKE